MKKKLLTFATALAMMLLCSFTTFAGSSFNDASPISVESAYNCEISSSGQIQYYYFTPAFSGNYTFYSSGSYDTYGYLYDSNQSLITSNDDGGEGRNFSITYYLNAGTKYYYAAKFYNSSYTGSFSVCFESDVSGSYIDLSYSAITLSTTSYTYNGVAKRPIVTVKCNGKGLTQNVDYVVSYSNNVNAGTAWATIHGIGYYCGSTSRSYTIVGKSLSNTTIKLSATSFTYDGNYKKPTVTVADAGKKLSNGVSYAYSYKNNLNAGTATVLIKGKGNYTGTVKKTFKINKKKITSCIIKHLTYNGESLTPAVYYNKKTVDSYGYTTTKQCKYNRDKDYTITFPKKKHKDIGSYAIKIKFKGNYTGTVKKNFKILPKPVKSVKTSPYSTTEIKVKWSKVKNVTGYKLYTYSPNSGKYICRVTTTSTSCTLKRPSPEYSTVRFYIRTYKVVDGKKYYNDSAKDCWDYEYVKPAKPAITIKKYDFGEFYVYFKTYDYYEVQTCENKNFRETSTSSVNTVRGYTNCVRFYNYTPGQKYYVRARRYYYNKDGELRVGPWSTVKNVTPY